MKKNNKPTLKKYWEANSSTERIEIVESAFTLIEVLEKQLALTRVVQQSEQLFCPRCGRHERIIGCSVHDYLCNDCGNVWAK